MERPLTLKPLSIQDENSAMHRKKVTFDGKSNVISRQAKKGGVVAENRKALNDITNKATSQKKISESKKCNIVKDGHFHSTGALSKTKNSGNEKLNIAEERFLHDHNKCIAAQKAAPQLNFWDIVLPGHDSSALKVEEAKVGDADIRPELEELLISDSFKSCWKSPPLSPLHSNSPPYAWQLDTPELMLWLSQDESSDV